MKSFFKGIGVYILLLLDLGIYFYEINSSLLVWFYLLNFLPACFLLVYILMDYFSLMATQERK